TRFGLVGRLTLTVLARLDHPAMGLWNMALHPGTVFFVFAFAWVPPPDRPRSLHLAHRMAKGKPKAPARPPPCRVGVTVRVVPERRRLVSRAAMPLSRKPCSELRRPCAPHRGPQC